MLALVLATRELRLEEDPVGRVVRGHVHLRAVQDVIVAVPTGGRLDRVDVGAGGLLGDRVALVALASHGRLDPPFDLLRRADGRRPGRGRVNAPAERVGHPADLLRNEDLLESRESAASEVLRHVHREQAERLRLRAMTVSDVLGYPALVLLGMDLPGDQLLVDEPTGALLDVSILGGHVAAFHGSGAYGRRAVGACVWLDRVRHASV